MPITISHEAVGPVLQAANLGGYGQHRKEVVRLNQQQQQIDDQYNLAQARLQQQQQQFESTQNMRAYENQQEQQMKMHQQAAEAEQAQFEAEIDQASSKTDFERKKELLKEGANYKKDLEGYTLDKEQAIKKKDLEDRRIKLDSVKGTLRPGEWEQLDRELLVEEYGLRKSIKPEQKKRDNKQVMMDGVQVIQVPVTDAQGNIIPGEFREVMGTVNPETGEIHIQKQDPQKPPATPSAKRKQAIGDLPAHPNRATRPRVVIEARIKLDEAQEEGLDVNDPVAVAEAGLTKEVEAVDDWHERVERAEAKKEFVEDKKFFDARIENIGEKRTKELMAARERAENAVDKMIVGLEGRELRDFKKTKEYKEAEKRSEELGELADKAATPAEIIAWAYERGEPVPEMPIFGGRDDEDKRDEEETENIKAEAEAEAELNGPITPQGGPNPTVDPITQQLENAEYDDFVNRKDEHEKPGDNISAGAEDLTAPPGEVSDDIEMLGSGWSPQTYIEQLKSGEEPDEPESIYGGLVEKYGSADPSKWSEEETAGYNDRLNLAATQKYNLYKILEEKYGSQDPSKWSDEEMAAVNAMTVAMNPPEEDGVKKPAAKQTKPQSKKSFLKKEEAATSQFSVDDIPDPGLMDWVNAGAGIINTGAERIKKSLAMTTRQEDLEVFELQKQMAKLPGDTRQDVLRVIERGDPQEIEESLKEVGMGGLVRYSRTPSGTKTLALLLRQSFSEG